jgi:hypothetical protein
MGHEADNDLGQHEADDYEQGQPETPSVSGRAHAVAVAGVGCSGGHRFSQRGPGSGAVEAAPIRQVQAAQ